ncbi:MAG: type I methionyl aminopeptidase [Deltaproteobacteria bacterium]|nr:type I methionyl aminopeptidase [Deltaproteobacteria bacterium]
MKRAGLLAWELMEAVEKMIAPGISTEDIDVFVEEMTRKRGAISAPLHYKGFPKSICTSVNEVVCHGIPSRKDVLKDGDIINVDVTPIVDGFHGDSSRTFLVGNVSPSAKRLVECARRCLDLGLAAVHDGCRLGDVGAAIQRHAEGQGFQVVREFVGHGIGREFHEDPQIPHYGTAGKGLRLTRGLVFTIEPMINAGDWRCEILEDGWTAVTIDGKLSAQFEHTVAIRHDGRVDILTLP